MSVLVRIVAQASFPDPRLHCQSQVEAIRAVKLAEMEAAGIPAKFRAELANKKLVNF